jgi:ubiquinol-cytochrome c reductase iron-sulfur subunit
VLFRDLAPADDPVELLSHTLWKKGTRLARDPDGSPIKASDVTLGSVFHVIPEGLQDLEHGKLEEKAKAAVLLMRLKPEDLNEEESKKDWSYNGIVAYSKICTHMGCPVALYEQRTHHLLCPCHQSTFDLTQNCKVIFGPAKRPLPQLAITVDDEGYLVAKAPFSEAVGPSFWERG